MQRMRGLGIAGLCLFVFLPAACSKNKGEHSDETVVEGNTENTGKGTVEDGDPSAYSIADLWVETKRITFKDHVRYGAGAIEVKNSSENQVPPDAPLAQRCQGKALARENIEDPGGSDEFVSVTYSCLDDKGVGHFAMVIPEQHSTETYKIKYELRSPVRMGQSWSSAGDASGSETRSCQVRASRYCDEGVATVCVTEKSGGALTWMRQHYCKGQGWRGYEVVTARAGVIGMQGWSSDVIADGVEFENVGEPTDLPTAEQVLADAHAIAEAATKAQ